jgi:hypothetical protein
MARNCKPLTLRQIRAAIMLAGGDEVKEVAARIRVTRESIRRWRRNPHFQRTCAEYTERLFEGALSEAQAKLSKAIGWLEDSHDAAPKESDKIKAAMAIINAAFRSHEIAVLKRELAKLRGLKQLVEQLMAGGGTMSPPMAIELVGEHTPQPADRA